MVNSRVVLAVGLGEDQLQRVRERVAGRPFSLRTAASALDLRQEDYFAAIVRRDAASPQQAEGLAAYFAKMDGGSAIRLFLAAEEDDLARAAGAAVYPSLGNLLPVLDDILDKGHQRAKRQESLVKSLSISFYLDEHIRQNPGVSTEALAQALKRSQAAVKRYIEELQMAGRGIVYDETLEGWRAV